MRRAGAFFMSTKVTGPGCAVICAVGAPLFLLAHFHFPLGRAGGHQHDPRNYRRVGVALISRPDRSRAGDAAGGLEAVPIGVEPLRCSQGGLGLLGAGDGPLTARRWWRCCRARNLRPFPDRDSEISLNRRELRVDRGKDPPTVIQRIGEALRLFWGRRGQDTGHCQPSSDFKLIPLLAARSASRSHASSQAASRPCIR